MSVQLNDLAKFLGGYAQASGQDAHASASECERLLQGVRPLYNKLAEERRRTARRFNVLEVLGVDRHELTHSAFLAFLLNPAAPHDQGARFLRGFLDLLEVQLTGEAELDHAEVRCECSFHEYGRLDIVIFLVDSSVIAIENKVDAPEQPKQVMRYQRWLSDQRLLGGQHHVLVFLTCDGREPVTKDPSSDVEVRCCSYRVLSDWLGDQTEIPPRLRSVVEMYAELCAKVGSTQ